ncbi:hypothetical protein [Streptomyces peucetius]|uniref:Uncharacterized protein n=1 Tax=Streptomyces peucetius TaxID=1950 RepID=A0ABY6IF40_STRPE|nr:hypothetical protein [Streptomyces peucetius]UYQ65638.1 hypothetical protein OGH68_32040 [Streptomyces peucetius]
MLKQTLRTAAVVALVAAVAAPVAVAAPASAPLAARPPAAVAALVPGAAPAAQAAVARTSVLEGEARLGYEVAEEAVRVTVDARSTYAVGSIPTRSWGTFRISHAIDGRDYWGDFEVDCLTTGGPTATVTGRLVRTSADHLWQTHLDPGTRMGLSFYVPRDKEARVGLSGATARGAPLLTRCMAPAADMAVVDGGYTLRDRETKGPGDRRG